MKFDLFCIFFFEIWKYMCWTMNLIDATCRNWSKLSSSGRCSKTLPKAQRTRGLSSSYQSNFLESYYMFKHKSWSNFIFRISTKPQLFNQASASPIKLKFKILTKLSFENLTKIQLSNLSKNISCKMLNKLELPNQQTVANMILSINISKSNNLNNQVY